MLRRGRLAAIDFHGSRIQGGKGLKLVESVEQLLVGLRVLNDQFGGPVERPGRFSSARSSLVTASIIALLAGLGAEVLCHAPEKAARPEEL